MDHPKIRLLIDMGINKLKTAMGASKKIVDNGVNSIKSKLGEIEVPAVRTGGFMSSLNGLKIMALAAVTALSAGIGKSISMGMEAAATKTSFEVMAGKGPGDALHENLTKFSQDSIFGNEVFKDAQTMLGFGMAVDAVMPRLKQLGDLSMGSADKLNSLSLVFAQTTAAGRLMGQDNMQYINAGFNPLNELAKMTGKSLGYWKEQMERGAISADMVGKAIDHATGPMGAFYQMTDKIGKTAYGQWQALQGQIQGIAVSLGTALLPVASKVMTYMAQLADYLPGVIILFEPVFTLVGIGLDMLVGGLRDAIGAAQLFSQWVQNNRTWLLALTAGILAGVAAYKAYQAWQVISYLWMMRQTVAQALLASWNAILATSTGVLTTAVKFLNAAFLTSPIGWIVLGVAALVAGIIYAYQKFDWFRGAVSGAWEVLKVFGDMLYDLTIGSIQTLLKGLGHLGKALYELFDFGSDGHWQRSWEEAKSAVTDLSGASTIKKVMDDGSKIGEAWKTGYASGVDGFNRDHMKQMTAEDFQAFYNKMGQKAGKGFADGVLNIMAQLPALMSAAMSAAVGAFNPMAGVMNAFAAKKGLNPDKATAGGPAGIGGGGKGTEGAPKASKVTGSSGQVRNITISFGSYIKGDMITQNKEIAGMSKEELSRWLKENFLRLIRSLEDAYA
jgi:hypothetical protein